MANEIIEEYLFAAVHFLMASATGHQFNFCNCKEVDSFKKTLEIRFPFFLLSLTTGCYL